MDTDRLDKMKMELRRGLLVLAVLRALRVEHYGYSLRKYLVANGIEIDEGTLYPLVRRLESQGLLTSDWREGEGRRKRYYRLSSDGETLLKSLLDEWTLLNRALAGLLEENP